MSLSVYGSILQVYASLNIHKGRALIDRSGKMLGLGEN